MVQGLADPATHDVDVLSMMLLLDDQPISIHYGFVHNRRYYAYMAARDPRHDACSPGKVHLEHLLKACFELGVETVDLLPPQMAYKQVWATGAADVEDFGVTWTVRGWIAGGLWRGHVRPAAKRLFLALPGGVRQRLVNNHPMPWIGGAGRSPNDNGQIDQCAIGPLVDDKMDAQFGIVVVVE